MNLQRFFQLKVVLFCIQFILPRTGGQHQSTSPINYKKDGMNYLRVSKNAWNDRRGLQDGEDGEDGDGDGNESEEDEDGEMNSGGEDEGDDLTTFSSLFRAIFLLNEDFDPFSDDPDDIVEAFQPLINEAGVKLQNTMNDMYEEMGNPFVRTVTDVNEIEDMSEYGLVSDDGRFVKDTEAPDTNGPAEEPGTESPTSKSPETTEPTDEPPSQEPGTESPTSKSPETTKPTDEMNTIAPTDKDNNNRLLMFEAFPFAEATGHHHTTTERLLEEEEFAAFPSIQVFLQVSGTCNGCPSDAPLTNQVTGTRWLQDDSAGGLLDIDEIVLRMNMQLEGGSLSNTFGSIVGIAVLEEIREASSDSQTDPSGDSISDDDTKGKGRGKGFKKSGKKRAKGAKGDKSTKGTKSTKSSKKSTSSSSRSSSSSSSSSSKMSRKSKTIKKKAKKKVKKKFSRDDRWGYKARESSSSSTNPWLYISDP